MMPTVSRIFFCYVCSSRKKKLRKTRKKEKKTLWLSDGENEVETLFVGKQMRLKLRILRKKGKVMNIVGTRRSRRRGREKTFSSSAYPTSLCLRL